MQAPGPRAYFILFVGLLAASQSGNIIRLGEAHFVAIAAWRLLFAGILSAVFARRDFSALKKLSRADIGLLLAAGVALALHFFLWIAAVQNTTVANAAMAVSISPVFTAVAAHYFFKEPVSRRLSLSIVAGLTGVAVICGNDFSLASGHIKGDLSAAFSAFFFMLYFLLGKRLQQKLPTYVYVSVLYSVAALAAFAVVPFTGVNVVHFNTQTWLCFLLMALVPTMMGHTSLNYSLRFFNAGHIAAATLVEPLFAGIVAYLAYGEKISAAAFLGYGFISLSVILVATDTRKKPSDPTGLNKPQI